jgi:hypothetical protein
MKSSDKEFLNHLEGFALRLRALEGYRDGTREALTYLHSVKVGCLEVLNTQSSDDPLIVRRKKEVLKELKELNELKKKYRQKEKQVFSNLVKKYKPHLLKPSSKEEGATDNDRSE